MAMKKILLLSSIYIVSVLTACTSKEFDQPQEFATGFVSAQTLNLGHDTYMNYCMQCHGIYGDGNGPASQGSDPLPRNFKLGIFKFGSVTSGELPLDSDLKHTILYGLRGTPMLPWDISEKRLDAVVQYIKTFSPRWQKEKPGLPQELTVDPWPSKGDGFAQQAILRGEKVYHGFAQCYTCHPSYVSLEKINEYSKELTGNAVTTIRENPHLSTLLDSSYGTKVMPPDFTKNFIKTGGGIAQIYKVLGTGIGGTAMPAWKGLLSPKGDSKESEENLWALAYYVNHLHALKYDLKSRKEFFSR